MKKFNKSFAIVAIATSIICATGIGIITDALINDVPNMLEEVSMMNTNTIVFNRHDDIVTTTETTTTSTTTTTTTTTEATTTTEEIVVDNYQELSYGYETEVVDYYVEENYYYEPTTYGISDIDKVMLANVVGGEYGSDWVSIYDKACVVATIMNRYYDGGWQGYDEYGNLRENTIYNIITAQGQYDPYYANYTYNWNVTQSCIDAVDYYFNNQELFPHITSFYGDGTYNYFS